MKAVSPQHDLCFSTMHSPIHHLSSFVIGWPTLYGPTSSTSPGESTSVRSEVPTDIHRKELPAIYLSRSSGSPVLVYQAKSDRIYPRRKCLDLHSNRLLGCCLPIEQVRIRYMSGSQRRPANDTQDLDRQSSTYLNCHEHASTFSKRASRKHGIQRSRRCI